MIATLNNAEAIAADLAAEGFFSFDSGDTLAISEGEAWLTTLEGEIVSCDGATLVEAAFDAIDLVAFEVDRRRRLDARKRTASAPLVVRPTTLKAANAFVIEHHRHHKARQGHKVSVALYRADELVGVAIGGIKTARMLAGDFIFEVYRVCVVDGVKNGCSKLLGAMAKHANACGYEKVITYTLPSEGGASLRAAGFVEEYKSKGGEWTRKDRKRADLVTAEKTRWSRQCKR